MANLAQEVMANLVVEVMAFQMLAKGALAYPEPEALAVVEDLVE
jgi:hypothetical protein